MRNICRYIIADLLEVFSLGRLHRAFRSAVQVMVADWKKIVK